MSCKIWVHAEESEGRIAKVTFELLSKARELAEAIGGGAKVEATLIGNALGSQLPLLAGYGAQTVYLADAPELRMYSPLTHVPILSKLAESYKPDIYLFGATAVGTTLGPAVAARLKTGMAAHCMDLCIDEKKQLKALVPSFGGKVIGEILCPERRPQMASVKPGIFVQKSIQSVQLNVETVTSSFWEQTVDKEWLTPVEIVKKPPRGMPLNEADVVVCGGLGLGSEEKWRLLEEFAQYIGGAVACTRPVVDEGWIEESAMVGTSGQSIRPKVYIGFGISGATHHICGMNDSGVVISVNNDADAPVFEVSDFRAVTDIHKILPLLVEAVKPGA